MKDGLNMKGGCGARGAEGVLCPVSWDPAAVYIIHRSTRFIQGDLHRSSFTCYHP